MTFSAGKNVIVVQAVQNNRMQVRVEVIPNKLAKDEYLN